MPVNTNGVLPFFADRVKALLEGERVPVPFNQWAPSGQSPTCVSAVQKKENVPLEVLSRRILAWGR